MFPHGLIPMDDLSIDEILKDDTYRWKIVLSLRKYDRSGDVQPRQIVKRILTFNNMKSLLSHFNFAIFCLTADVNLPSVTILKLEINKGHMKSGLSEDAIAGTKDIAYIFPEYRVLRGSVIAYSEQ